MTEIVYAYIKRGFRMSSVYALTALATRGISFLFLPFVLRSITLTDFGMWDFYQNIFSYGTLMLSSTAATSMTRFYVGTNDEYERNAVIGNASYGILICAIIAMITMVCFYHALSLHAILTIINIICFSCFSLVLAYYRMHERVWIYATLFFMQSVGALGATMIGLWYGYGLLAFFYANIGASLCMMPLYARLLYRYRAWSYSLLKQQLWYSIPLCAYAFLYSCLYTVDRFYIQSYAGGFETLGLYGLLWRFGALFQMCAVALADAWIILISDIARNHDKNKILPSLIVYYSALLMSGGIASIIISYGVISCMFPFSYHAILSELPIFFMALTFVELARVASTGLLITKRTISMPMITASILGMQMLFYVGISACTLHAIIAANAIAFSVYILFMAYASSVYAESTLFKRAMLGKLSVMFGGYVVCCYLLIHHTSMWYTFCVLGLSWPGALYAIGLFSLKDITWIAARVQHESEIIVSASLSSKEYHEQHSK